MAPLTPSPRDRVVREVQNLDIELLVRLVVRSAESVPQRVRRMALPDVELGLDPGVRAVDPPVAVVVVVAVGVLERQLRRVVRAELQSSRLEVEQEPLG